MNALNIIEDNTTPNAAADTASARKRQRVAQKPTPTSLMNNSNLNKFKNNNQKSLEVYEDEEDGDKENRDPNVTNNRRHDSNFSAGSNNNAGVNDESQMKKMKSNANVTTMDSSGEEEAAAAAAKVRVNTKIFNETKPSAPPRAPFVAKLYSSLPKTSRVVLGDITRNHSPNRLAPGKYRIGPVSSLNGEQKRSEGGNATNNNRTSILKVR
jgi:hypothetical protein